MGAICKPPFISLVIPTINRTEVLLDTIQYLSCQEYQDFEVIVVDQSDTPNHAVEELLANFRAPAAYFHITHFRGLPEARNFGWRKAQGEIVVYIDDDIRCGADFLRAHFDAHASSKAAMVGGRITEAKGDVTRPGETGSFDWWRATPTRNFHLSNPGWCDHAPGGNFSIRRKVLEEIAGFDENLSVGAALYEETELGLRLRSQGYRCWFAPEAHLTHLAAPMGGCRVNRDVPRYVYGMGHNRAILIFRHLRFWHRPSALLRMLVYGLSYSIADRSVYPILAAIRGLMDGKAAARQVKS